MVGLATPALSDTQIPETEDDLLQLCLDRPQDLLAWIKNAKGRLQKYPREGRPPLPNTWSGLRGANVHPQADLCLPNGSYCSLHACQQSADALLIAHLTCSRSGVRVYGGLRLGGAFGPIHFFAMAVSRRNKASGKDAIC